MSGATPLEMKATASVTIEGPFYDRENEYSQKPEQRRHRLYHVEFEGTPADLQWFLSAVLDSLNLSTGEAKEEKE